MSVFVPFKAIRPTKETVAAVASKPYDVLNAKEARSESAGNPFSFYHVIKPEINYPENSDRYSPEVYQKGKENFDKLVNEGIMAQDQKEYYYVYQLSMNSHDQTGIVGCCSIDDYFNNTIKKHELTRPDKEEDRKNHIRVSKLNYEPVFFSYSSVDAIDDIVNEVKNGTPEYDFVTDDGVRHYLWIIHQPEMLDKISTLFKNNVPNLYIADGHHRTAANAFAGKEIRKARGGKANDGKRDNYFMAVLFPDNQLKILDYNRVIKDLNGLNEKQFINLLSNSFNIEEQFSPYRPDTMHTFGMYLNRKWYKLTSISGTYDDNDPIGQLDVTILSKNILEPLLNIIDLRTDDRIDFVGGLRGTNELERRVDSGEMKIAFTLYPISMQQLINISDNDLIMPPKVTWFEPRLRSGLFVHNLDE